MFDFEEAPPQLVPGGTIRYWPDGSIKSRSLYIHEVDFKASTKWGGRTGHGLRVRIDAEGKVRAATEEEYEVPWKLPPDQQRIVQYFEDWHGTYSISLPATMPKQERDRITKLTTTRHGPHSTLACCLKKRIQFEEEL